MKNNQSIEAAIPALNTRNKQQISLLKKVVFLNFHGKMKKYGQNSLYIFKADSKFRQKVIWLVEWKIFEYFILLVILVNCITLSLYDYSDRTSQTPWNHLLDELNFFFTSIYSLEALLKIIAYGFVMHTNSYLRETWNIVDFIVVIFGIVEVIFSQAYPELRILRTVRVLRPLKIINTLPGIRKHAEILVLSMPSFINVGLFLLFIFLLFAILGLHQYEGAFLNRCRIQAEPEFPGVSWAIVQSDPLPCTKNGLGRHKCNYSTGEVCGNPYDKGIPLDSDDITNNVQIFYGITSFNNIASSMLLINQLVSTDDWSSFMYNLMDVDSPIFAVLYCLTVIIIGTFFIMNLILAVIIDTYVKLEEEELKKSKASQFLVSDEEFGLPLTPSIVQPAAVQDFQLEDLEGSLDIKIIKIQKTHTQLYVKGTNSLQNDTFVPRTASLEVNQLGNIDIEYSDDKRRENIEKKVINKLQIFQNNHNKMMQDDDFTVSLREHKQDLKLNKMDIMMHNKEQSENDMVSTDYHMLMRAGKSKIYKICYGIINNYYFGLFISMAIIANTIVQSLDQYPKPAYLKNMDEIGSFFSCIFILEFILKLAGLGVKYYFIDPFNRFDCLIVMTSILDLLLTNVFVQSNINSVTYLRTARLLRIFKLAKSWKQFHQLLKTIWKTLVEISSFTIVLLLFMFIYAILGMEVFAYKARFNSSNKVDLINGDPINQNFDSFIWSFTTVFVLMTEDGWSSIFYQYHRAVSGWKSTLYFISLFIIGPRVLLNLFLAILLQNFDDDSIESDIKREIEPEQKDDNSLIVKLKLYLGKCFKSHRVKIQTPQLSESPKSQDNERRFKDVKGIRQSKINKNINTKLKLKDSSKFIDDLYLQGISLNLFQTQNIFRKQLFDVITSRTFEQFIICLISVSCIQLGLSNPTNDPKGSLSRGLYWVDFLMTILFVTESILKIITYGFLLNGKPSYLRNPWNLVDFAIILLSVVSLSPLSNQLQIFKMFRVLRVLRLISRAEGLRIGLQSLLQAVPNVLRIVLIMILFYLLFGIVAVSYFKGKFFSCNDSQVLLSIPDLESTINITNKWECLNAGAEWYNTYYNFDNMYQAIATLFIMSNITNWQNIMYIGAQVTDIDFVWRKWSHPYWVFFFIGFMIFGAFFLINLFVGVVISSFNRQKDHLGGSNLLTEEQRLYLELHLLILKIKPIKKARMPLGGFGCFCYKVNEYPYFEDLIYLSIILNTIVLTLQWAGQSDSNGLTIDYVNYVFTCIFIVEAVIKITAMGYIYFSDLWNIFDFIILAMSIFTICLDFLTTLQLGSSFTVVRAFRISKILRLIRKSKNLRHIFKTFIVSIKPVFNIGSLLLLILYMYAVAGVMLFGQVMRNGKLNDSLNFETFSNAALVLFVVATTDGWNEISTSCLKRRRIDFQCLQSPTYDDYVNNGRQTIGCGPKFSGVLYFYSYFLIMCLVLLKLFMAIILQAYESIKEQDRRIFNEDLLEIFRQSWLKLDHDGTGFIPLFELKALLTDLSLHLNFPNDNDNEGQDHFIKSLDLPTYKNFTSYFFTDVLNELAFRQTIIDIVQNKETKSGDISFDEQCHSTRIRLLYEIHDLVIANKTQEIQMLKEIESALIEVVRFRGDAFQMDDYYTKADMIKQLTSYHQILAQNSIQKMKEFIIFRKLQRNCESVKSEKLVTSFDETVENNDISADQSSGSSDNKNQDSSREMILDASTIGHRIQQLGMRGQALQIMVQKVVENKELVKDTTKQVNLFDFLRSFKTNNTTPQLISALNRSGNEVYDEDNDSQFIDQQQLYPILKKTAEDELPNRRLRLRSAVTRRQPEEHLTFINVKITRPQSAARKQPLHQVLENQNMRTLNQNLFQEPSLNGGQWIIMISPPEVVKVATFSIVKKLL